MSIQLPFRYHKDNLIKDFIEDIDEVFNLSKKSEKNIIDEISLGNDFIQFRTLGGLVDRLKATPENLLKIFDNMWGGRVFEGTAGYYTFGDILHQSVLLSDYDIPYTGYGIVNILRFPFYKITYTSYFDELNEEVLYVIISKFDLDELTAYMRLYPKLRLNANLFRLLTRDSQPRVYADIMTVYPDFTKEEESYFSWDKIYMEILKLIKNHRGVSFVTYNLDPLKLYTQISGILNDLFSHVKVKAIFPLMYQLIVRDKFSPHLSAWRSFYRELGFLNQRSDRETNPFYIYTKTGSFPEGYVLAMSDVYKYAQVGTETADQLLYLVAINPNVKYESTSTYLRVLDLATSDRNFIKALFDNLGVTKFSEILTDIANELKGHGSDERPCQLARKVIGYILRSKSELPKDKFKEFISHIDLNVLREVSDNCLPEWDARTRKEVEAILT